MQAFLLSVKWYIILGIGALAVGFYVGYLWRESEYSALMRQLTERARSVEQSLAMAAEEARAELESRSKELKYEIELLENSNVDLSKRLGVTSERAAGVQRSAARAASRLEAAKYASLSAESGRELVGVLNDSSAVILEGAVLVGDYREALNKCAGSAAQCGAERRALIEWLNQN